MGRDVTCSVYWTHGKPYVKAPVTPKRRRTFPLVGCPTPEEAEARGATIAGIIRRLRAAHRGEYVEALAEQAARAATARQLAGVLALVNTTIDGEETREARALTVAELGKRWTDGELAEAFPGHVKALDHEANGNGPRLKKWVYPIVGTIPVDLFRLEHGEMVMRQPDLPAGSRRHVAQLVGHLMQLAVYPARLITVSPIPRGWLPKPNPKKAGAFLYPDEEAALLACTKVPLIERLLFGVLAREGMRASEAGELEWSDVDLKRGAITLAENKTDDPRSWMLDAGVLATLTWWSELHPGSRWVFEVPHRKTKTPGPINVRHLAAQLRDALMAAKLKREALFARSATRQRLRAHDLRATFVTLALANGKTETWVSDRTGHTSSVMINRYRRAARHAAELGLGELMSLNLALPEVSANVHASDSAGGQSGTFHNHTGKDAVRRGGLEPPSLAAREPKAARGAPADARAANFAENEDAVEPLVSLGTSADGLRTLRRRPRGRVGRAAEVAVAAALSGDPDQISPAMHSFAAAVKRSPFRAARKAPVAS